jgi:hypothetical protein
MRARGLFAIVLMAMTLVSLAGVMAQTSGNAPPAGTAPHSRGLESPKVLRWVCTDHLCGGCDGACSRRGHVAVSRGGHCACTPTAGSKLDQAINEAFQGHVKGR